MNNFTWLLILILTPLAGFFVNGLLYNRKNMHLAGALGSCAVFVSFISSLALFINLRSSGDTEYTVTLWKWISTNDLHVAMGLSLNRLSALMCMLITGVGFLIHIFSVEYMSEDETPHKYFSYLNLFIFNMLILVLGENLLVTFIGWEGVGLCSYLLIGYWYTDKKKASAGMKAFVVNRIGDAGFIAGMILLYLHFGSLNYSVINELASNVVGSGWGAIHTLAVLMIFIGVAGKSAQFPLFVWLPDAMAGPTPVSALIHAATMVTAGVFVLFRLNGLLEASPEGMFLIACTGALTAFIAGCTALSQWDIKKVLAYSTVSQLGYMVLAIGVGSYVGAVFHLLTHAFFKALLFLGSGSVIHGLGGEQDMKKMGGLKELMPTTYRAFFIGWLAIIGVPIFSGFFSKDEILLHVFTNERGSWALWVLAVLTAGITAFYMTRLMAHVFWSEPRFDKSVKPHEGSVLLQGPLFILMLLSVCGGALGLPHFLSAILPGHPEHFLMTWLSPMLAQTKAHEISLLLELVLMFASVFVVSLAAAAAYLLYIKKNEQIDRLALSVKKDVLLKTSRSFFFIDQLYQDKIIQPFKGAAASMWLHIDVGFIDKALDLIGKSIISTGRINKTLHTGQLQTYISIFAVFVALTLVGALFI